jgi:hypothetical protein
MAAGWIFRSGGRPLPPASLAGALSATALPQGEGGVSPSLKYRMVVFFSSVSLNNIS